MSTILYGVVSSYQFISDKVPDICGLFFNKLQCICCNLSASYFQAYGTEDQDRSVGTAWKVSPDWSHKTVTCHSSNCFSIFGGQGNAPLVTSLPSSCYMTLPGNSGFEQIGF